MVRVLHLVGRPVERRQGSAEIHCSHDDHRGRQGLLRNDPGDAYLLVRIRRRIGAIGDIALQGGLCLVNERGTEHRRQLHPRNGVGVIRGSRGARNVADAEGSGLRVFGEEIPHRQRVLAVDHPVGIGQVLIAGIDGRNAVVYLLEAPVGGAGNVIGSRWEVYVEDVESCVADIRPIAGHLRFIGEDGEYRAPESRQIRRVSGMIRRAHRRAQGRPESRRRTVARGNGWQDGAGASAARDSVALASSLVAAKEEQLVLLDGPADGSAELVLLQNLLDPFCAVSVVAVIEKAVGVQVLIAEKLK